MSMLFCKMYHGVILPEGSETRAMGTGVVENRYIALVDPIPAQHKVGFDLRILLYLRLYSVVQFHWHKKFDSRD